MLVKIEIKTSCYIMAKLRNPKFYLILNDFFFFWCQKRDTKKALKSSFFQLLFEVYLLLRDDQCFKMPKVHCLDNFYKT